MPTVTLEYKDLCKLVRRALPLKRLEYALPLIKCEVKSIEDGEITVEVTPDRPDLFSTEGIARALRGFLGIEVGYPRFNVRKGRVIVRVAPYTQKIRPYIACAVLRDVKFTDAFVAQLMQLQEKIHETLGRRRSKASIGIYNLDSVETPITFTALKPNEIKFTPLGEAKPMTGEEILTETEKGRDYAHIIRDLPRYPMLIDAKGRVLSMPPIINSEETKVTVRTRNLFVDVTGMEEHIVNEAVNIIVTATAERKAILESVEIQYPHRKTRTATLNPRRAQLDIEPLQELSGLNIDSDGVIQLVEKMMLGIGRRSKRRLEVLVPPYRCDIIHPVDLIEDVVLGYGYDRIEPQLPQTVTYGRELSKVAFTRKVRELIVGFGFQEVANYMLTSEENQIRKMRLENSTEMADVANPLTREFSVVRTWLLPEILAFLSYNTHVDYPQRVFECGDAVLIDEEAETKIETETKVAAAICDYKSSYESIQAIAYGLLQNLGLASWDTKSMEHLSFIQGRAAHIMIGGEEIAVLGEIHPKVLSNFGIPNPVTALEVNLTSILKAKLG